MSENTISEQDDRNLRSSIRQKPKRRSSSGPAALLLWLGGIIIVGGLIVLAWQVLSHSSQGGNTTEGTGGNSGASTNKATSGQADPPVYWQTLQQQVAQGLHLSVAEVKAKLQAGASLTDVAAQQNVTSTQLHTIELNALRKGHDKLVSLGLLTQQQSDQGMTELSNRDVDTLNRSMTNWILEH